MTPNQPDSPSIARLRPERLRPTYPPVGRRWASTGMGLRWRLERNLTEDAAGHLLWQGGVNGNGYPIISFERRVSYVAHLLWELAYGEPPGRLRSTCGVRQCVKPEHRIPASKTSSGGA